jgi:hypothetical protein
MRGHFLRAASPKGGGGGGGPTPAVLLHFDGTNGSTTFTDSSPNNFTITAAGNAQLSTTGPKFGTACGLFDGAGDYIDIPASSELSFPGQFCVDGWLYSEAITGFRTFYEIGLYTDGILLRLTTPYNDFVFVNGVDMGNITPFVTLYTWTHLAVTRDGSNMVRVFVDGTQRLSATISGTVNSTAAAGRIAEARHNSGQTFQGRIDEFRVVKGDAVWTADFTPPTAAYS